MFESTVKIKIAILRKRITEAEITRLMGYKHRASISAVVCGIHTTKRVREFLSQYLNLPMNIWKRMDEEISAAKRKKAA